MRNMKDAGPFTMTAITRCTIITVFVSRCCYERAIVHSYHYLIFVYWFNDMTLIFLHPGLPIHLLKNTKKCNVEHVFHFIFAEA